MNDYVIVGIVVMILIILGILMRKYISKNCGDCFLLMGLVLGLKWGRIILVSLIYTRFRIEQTILSWIVYGSVIITGILIILTPNVIKHIEDHIENRRKK